VPLTAVNEWPPQGGATFLTPAYGSLKATSGVSVLQLVPADPVHLAATIAGTYRVAAIGAATAQDVQGPLLGFGSAALSIAPLPSVGDSVTVSASTLPPLDTVATAVGGGPLLLSDGAFAEDTNAPAPEETDVRFPVAGAGLTPSGELLLATVDGRSSALSIGLTRPEFAALFLGLGADNAMAFDSGGSATLVARVLGDESASVLNEPSDGEERAVADGFFVYSDAPSGPPSRLVVRPDAIVALPHAAVALRLALTDAWGHGLGVAHLAHGDAIVAGGKSEQRVLRVGKVSARVAIDVVARVSRLALAVDQRDPAPGATVTFTATGFDSRGRPVALGGAVRWSADRGRFSKPGVYVAAARDALIVATAPGARGSFVLPVGRHVATLPFFDPAHAATWHFSSVPSGSPGSLTFAAGQPELDLSYDFSSGERAAFAEGDFALPGDPQTFALDIRGDRSGVGVRAAFVNRFGERRALTLAKSVDWSGWQMRSIVLPDDLNPPVQLVSLYAVDSLANGATRARERSLSELRGNDRGNAMRAAFAAGALLACALFAVRGARCRVGRRAGADVSSHRRGRTARRRRPRSHRRAGCVRCASWRYLRAHAIAAITAADLARKSRGAAARTAPSYLRSTTGTKMRRRRRCRCSSNTERARPSTSRAASSERRGT
jgi:hypothetical protein